MPGSDAALFESRPLDLLLLLQFVKKGLLQKSEGNFSTEFPGEFCGGFFWWIFSGLFLGKKEENIHPKIHGKIQIENLGALRPKSTLQGSGLDSLGSSWVEDRGSCLPSVEVPAFKVFSIRSTCAALGP